MNSTIFIEKQLEISRKLNEILLFTESGASISAKTVGMMVEDILSILQAITKELKEIKQKEASHE